jgi:arylsulfatase A-like enzyme
VDEISRLAETDARRSERLDALDNRVSGVVKEVRTGYAAVIERIDDRVGEIDANVSRLGASILDGVTRIEAETPKKGRRR